MNLAELHTREGQRENVAADVLELLATNLLRLGFRGRIQRVDISRAGDLTVLAAVDGQQLWMRVDNRLCERKVKRGESDELLELKASDDPKIPLAHQLTAMDSGPGMTVLSYIPHRRLVILDSRGAHAQVLKGYRKGRGGSSADKYALAAKASIPGRFFAPEPTRFNARHDYLTMPFVEGTPFQVSSDRKEDFEALGKGIRKLQYLDDAAGRLHQFSREDELGVVDERARRMRLAGCALPDGWADLRSRLEQLSRNLPFAASVPAHRDLHDGQLLRGIQGITLLDFDLFCRAEPELDPANFLAHLSLRRLQMPHRVSDQCVQLCGKKFLDGMGSYERDGFWERLRFYQATSFCRLQLVYSLRPRWSAIVAPLGRLGHRCLDDLEHLGT